MNEELNQDAIEHITHLYQEIEDLTSFFGAEHDLVAEKYRELEIIILNYKANMLLHLENDTI
ncbi:hypothetical protein [Longirhabdus pacifica]|uniref:hypothetical protein n=1 Tax=Longirhabdus pacifica TaxID=2305227 RepID=UPI001008B7E9|nr:hypothetical protein [Longirhabdus pacifica]